MKHIKTYENWFTNLFKGGHSDIWQNYMDNTFGSKFSTGYNALMGSAEEGNWARFKDNFNQYSAVINSINIEVENEKETKKTLLMHIVLGDGGLWEKKKMLEKTLSYPSIDINITNEDGKTFYDLITDPKLKKWIDEKYPNLETELSSNKYNL